MSKAPPGLGRPEAGLAEQQDQLPNCHARTVSMARERPWDFPNSLWTLGDPHCCSNSIKRYENEAYVTPRVAR